MRIGRIAAGADIDTIGLTLTGSGHLLFADQDGTGPDPGAVEAMVTAVLAAAEPHLT